jgi:putative transcriptional regulator
MRGGLKDGNEQVQSPPVHGMQEAAAFRRRPEGRAQVQLVRMADVRAIRWQLRMSQQRFTETYGVTLPTPKNWEQGGRAGRRPTCRPLRTRRKLSKRRCSRDDKARASPLTCKLVMLLQRRAANDPARRSVAGQGHRDDVLQ